ncbi:uncharacterized protein LOC144994650 [Oryzias latipes]
MAEVNRAGDKADMATEEPQGKIQQMWQETGALIADLKKTMEKLLTTQSNLEELLQKTEGMENAANQFGKTSNKVAWYYKCKNIKLIVVLVGIALIIVLLIVLLATRVIPVDAAMSAFNSTAPKP